MELIDTWWDVNDDELLDEAFNEYGINRYMVGCKCRYASWLDIWKLELIDTWWDVNMCQRN